MALKKFALTLLLTLLGFELPAFASEFQEQAMCAALNSDAAFPRISIQTEPTNPKRALLILMASDGWTQIYSGPVKSSKTSLSFAEDKSVITATFLKDSLKASISFNGDDYTCDERSFGN